MTKRPVAFRVPKAGGDFWITDNERHAQIWASEGGTGYEGLYLVSDRHLPPTGHEADAMTQDYQRILEAARQCKAETGQDRVLSYQIIIWLLDKVDALEAKLAK